MNIKSLWSGDDNDKARQDAANNIAAIINGHKFAEGETLNIVGHSHGGNVAALLSQKVNHKIDNLVTLETPIRDDYKFNEDNIGNHIHTYSDTDPIQGNGGRQIKLWYKGIVELGTASRRASGPEVTNVNIEGIVGKNILTSHSKAWINKYADRVWSKVVNELPKE